MDISKITKKLERAKQYLQNDVPDIIGIEAVNHFKDSFQNEGFTDTSLEKWEPVKRSDSSSRWYGFKYKSTSSRPGQTKRKEGGYSNYSDAATSRPILSGETQELMNAIDYTFDGRRVTITAHAKYAQIHNEGGDMKVFGRSGATMPKRQFMGKSEVLRKHLQQMIRKDLLNILK